MTKAIFSFPVPRLFPWQRTPLISNYSHPWRRPKGNNSTMLPPRDEITGHNTQIQGERQHTFPSEMPIPSKPQGGRPPSPPPLLLARPRISPRTSLTSVKRMPVIREDEAPLLLNVPHRRSRTPRAGVFYQYGEDYITPWHLVGIPSSPSPTRAPSKQQGSSVGGRAAGRGLGLPDGEPGAKEGSPPVRVDAWAARQGGWRRLCERRYRSWL